MFHLQRSISMGRKRPNPVRIDDYLLDCVQVVEEAHDGLPSDKTLCDLVRLQVFADELTPQILPHGNTVIPESRVRSAHEAFEQRMRDWQEKKGHASASRESTMLFCFAFIYKDDSSSEMGLLLTQP